MGNRNSEVSIDSDSTWGSIVQERFRVLSELCLCSQNARVPGREWYTGSILV